MHTPEAQRRVGLSCPNRATIRIPFVSGADGVREWSLVQKLGVADLGRACLYILSDLVIVVRQGAERIV
jgi:hypothetical protein